MLNKTVLIVTVIVLLLLSASDMAQLAAVPATQPIDENDPIAVSANFMRTSQVLAQRLSMQFKWEFGASDQDIAILVPLIQKCIVTSTNAKTANSLSGYGARNITMADADESPGLAGLSIGPALIDLDHLLADKNTPIAVIKAQMEVVRKLRQRADDDYAAARKELRSHTTRRQEAFFILNNVLN